MVLQKYILIIVIINKRAELHGCDKQTARVLNVA